ncbi:hypothetical protein SAMN05444354_113159 [Stigmatella aurantiaca]|uniref:Uncharacterized protein n=1 Tax=Stigmatella aurantiaca TaxID=41 RepID=A0A1H7WS31_STIAU|nr:hypothetical protein SAMN05444354_113159 [Stigmatella aurantiaca]
MSRKTVLVGLAGGLLPIPLILLMAGALRPTSPETAPGGRRISPVLDTEMRTKLSTYRRSCGPGRPCEAPLGCVWDTRIFTQYCTDSQCLTDLQCPQGQVCRPVATEGEGPLVRFCVPIGRRQEGERCLALAKNLEAACAAGLLCGGKEGWCARPCQSGATDACPVGFFCAETALEPVCLPSCERQGCPAGQHCIRYEESASACAEVQGDNCQSTPCPEGLRCQVEYERARPGQVRMNCVAR